MAQRKQIAEHYAAAIAPVLNEHAAHALAFKEWAASIVYSGHDYTYERLSVAGFPFIENGVGGNELYEIGDPLPESQVRRTDVHGLVLVTITATELVSHFLDAEGKELDVLRLANAR